MGNYNILITNPSGGRRHQFAENQGMRECKDWMEEFGPAPIGWAYQIVNMNKRPEKLLDHVEIKGYKEDGTIVGTYRANKLEDGVRSLSPKEAKKTLRALGAVYFTRNKVWENGHG